MNEFQLTEADKQIIERLGDELKQLKNTPEIPIHISPLAAWCLIIQIQLLSRHPGNKNWMYDTIEKFAHELEDRLEMTTWLKEYLDKGWNPEFDVTLPPKK